MRVLLDLHAANCGQQSAVACCIASSHEDLHGVTSISSCVDLNSQSVAPSIVSRRLGLEFRSTTTVRSHQEILPINVGCWAVKLFHPPILNMDRSITNFGSILAFITFSFKNFSLTAMIFTNFSFITIFWFLFSLFQLYSLFQIFPSTALRAVTFSTRSFHALLL